MAEDRAPWSESSVGHLLCSGTHRVEERRPRGSVSPRHLQDARFARCSVRAATIVWLTLSHSLESRRGHCLAGYRCVLSLIFVLFRRPEYTAKRSFSLPIPSHSPNWALFWSLPGITFGREPGWSLPGITFGREPGYSGPFLALPLVGSLEPGACITFGREPGDPSQQDRDQESQRRGQHIGQ